MNKRLSLLTTALLLTGASSAFAASSTDLTVTGFITPAACTPSLSGGGIVDHAKIPVKDLNQDRDTRLTDATLQLSVNCNAPAVFALRGIDNRAASAVDPSMYGLGLINGTQKLGYYDLLFLNAMADGTVTTPLKSGDNGSTWSELATGTSWMPTDLAGFGGNAGGAWLPLAIEDLTTDLVVHTYIKRASDLDLSNEVPIDGSATLEVKYL